MLLTMARGRQSEHTRVTYSCERQCPLAPMMTQKRVNLWVNVLFVQYSKTSTILYTENQSRLWQSCYHIHIGYTTVLCPFNETIYVDYSAALLVLILRWTSIKGHILSSVLQWHILHIGERILIVSFRQFHYFFDVRSRLTNRTV